MEKKGSLLFSGDSNSFPTKGDQQNQKLWPFQMYIWQRLGRLAEVL